MYDSLINKGKEIILLGDLNIDMSCEINLVKNELCDIYHLYNIISEATCFKVASKCSAPLLDHLARYFGMVTLLSYTSTWHTFKQSMHDRSYMSVELLSLPGQGYL